jgi:hypothetical protein
MFDQQLDLDGNAHDIAPRHERLKLFEPAPTQIEGQAYIRDDELVRGDGSERASSPQR